MAGLGLRRREGVQASVRLPVGMLATKNARVDACLYLRACGRCVARLLATDATRADAPGWGDECVLCSSWCCTGESAGEYRQALPLTLG